MAFLDSNALRVCVLRCAELEHDLKDIPDLHPIHEQATALLHEFIETVKALVSTNTAYHDFTADKKQSVLKIWEETASTLDSAHQFFSWYATQYATQFEPKLQLTEEHKSLVLEKCVDRYNFACDLERLCESLRNFSSRYITLGVDEEKVGYAWYIRYEHTRISEKIIAAWELANILSPSSTFRQSLQTTPWPTQIHTEQGKDDENDKKAPVRDQRVGNAQAGNDLPQTSVQKVDEALGDLPMYGTYEVYDKIWVITQQPEAELEVIQELLHRARNVSDPHPGDLYARILKDALLDNSNMILGSCRRLWMLLLDRYQQVFELRTVPSLYDDSRLAPLRLSQFSDELFNMRLLSEKIADEAIQAVVQLPGITPMVRAEIMEQLVETSSPKTKAIKQGHAFVDRYFESVSTMADDEKLPLEMRFLYRGLARAWDKRIEAERDGQVSEGFNDLEACDR